jgi:hypothetical protein
MHNPMDPAVEAAFEDARIVLGLVREWEQMSEKEQYARQVDMAMWRSRSDDDRRRYLLSLYKPSKGRGQPSKAARNQAIVDLITYIQHRHKINPTRNRATSRDRWSGCAIVSQVLRELGFDLKEEGVADVWRRMSHLAKPDQWIPALLSYRRSGVRE